MKTNVSHFVVLNCLRNSDGGTPAKKKKGTTHPSTLPDLDAPPRASRGRVLPLERRQCCGPSAAMGVKLSASEASQPTNVSKNSSGCCAACAVQPFQVHVEVKKKSNVSAIFSNDQMISHICQETLVRLFFYPRPPVFFPFHSSITGCHQWNVIILFLSDVRSLIVHTIAQSINSELFFLFCKQF